MGRKRSRSRDRSGNSGVSRRAVLGLVLAGGAGLAGAQQTGAFSSVTGDRGFDVQTASDQNALLGIETYASEGQSGSSVPIFTLSNRFSGQLTIDQVSVISSGSLGITRDDLSLSKWTLGSGEQSDIEATISCGQSTTDDITLEIAASTDDESIELTRSATVTCQQNSDPCAGDPRRVIDNTEEDIDDPGVVIVISSNSKLSGSVSDARCVILKEDAEVTGEVSANNNISLGEKAQIKGEVEAGGNVSLGEKAQIEDNVCAGGSVSLDPKSVVKGDVTAGGSITVDKQAQIKGEANSGATCEDD